MVRLLRMYCAHSSLKALSTVGFPQISVVNCSGSEVVGTPELLEDVDVDCGANCAEKDNDQCLSCKGDDMERGDALVANSNEAVVEPIECDEAGLSHIGAFYFDPADTASPRLGAPLLSSKGASKSADSLTAIILRNRVNKKLPKPQVLSASALRKTVSLKSTALVLGAPALGQSDNMLVTFTMGVASSHPECPDCATAITVTKQIASMRRADIKVYRFRCETAQKLCDDFRVSQYPELRLYTAQGYRVYSGRLTAKRVAQWAERGMFSNATVVNEGTYPALMLKQSPIVFLFCTSWSAPCRRVEPMFARASTIDIKYDGIRYHPVESDTISPPPPPPTEQVLFRTIDCGTDESLCDKYNVVVYPTLAYVDAAGKSHLYQGQITEPYTIIDHVLDTHNPPVVELDPILFQSKVLRTQSIWLLLFTGGIWCEPCNTLAPVYRKVAKELYGVLKVGWVDCDKWVEFCVSHSITAYPMVRLYTVGKSTVSNFNPSGNNMIDGKNPAAAEPLGSHIPLMTRPYTHFSGEWQPGTLTAWVSDQLPYKLIKLTAATFHNKVCLRLRLRSCVLFCYYCGLLWAAR